MGACCRVSERGGGLQRSRGGQGVNRARIEEGETTCDWMHQWKK